MTDQADRPVSLIEGDRLCVTCAYNLRGQAVYKEPHYGLYLARCPECATPAAIQEYPMLGRWPGRIRVFVGLMYAFFALMLFGFTITGLSGMSAVLSEVGAEGRATQIAEEMTAYINSEIDAGRDPMQNWIYGIGTNPDGHVVVGTWTPVDGSWYDEHAVKPVLTERITDTLRHGLNVLFVSVLSFAVLSVIWPVYFLSARPWVVFLLGLLAGGVVLTIFFLAQMVQQSSGQWTTPSTLASGEYLLPAVVLNVLLWAVLIAIGSFTGRPLARLFVRAMLPPTMRGSMAELWFTDGKPLPAGTRAPRTMQPEACKVRSS